VLDLETECRRANKICADWLLFIEERQAEYRQHILEVAEQRNDIIYSGTFAIDQAKPSNRLIGDRTGSRGAKLAVSTDRLEEELRTFEAWAALITDIEDALSWKMKTFLSLRREYRYNRGRVGWVVPVQRRYCEEVAKREGKQLEDCWLASRGTFNDMWNKILTYAVRKACKRKLLK
jgi:hypothetical protein